MSDQPVLPLFVYGALASGGELEWLLGPAERCPATVRGVLYMMPGGSPPRMPAKRRLPQRQSPRSSAPGTS